MLLDGTSEGDERRSVGKRDDPGRNAEELRQQRGGEGLPGGPVGQDPPVLKKNGAVAPGRKLQLVSREKNRRARRRPAPERLEDDQAVTGVEARCRLVEQHHLGLTGEDTGQEDALPLTATHLAEVGLGEGFGVQLCEGAVGGREVGRPGRRKTAPVRHPAEENGVESAYREEGIEALREIPDPPGRLAAGNRV